MKTAEELAVYIQETIEHYDPQTATIIIMEEYAEQFKQKEPKVKKDQYGEIVSSGTKYETCRYCKYEHQTCLKEPCDSVCKKLNDNEYYRK
ncbi:MAG: hypothetical protein WC389_17020 [Lutibacter sp.]|jgi:hypothetical protein